MHFLLFYEKAPDHVSRQAAWQTAHIDYLQAFVRRGELLLAGSLSSPEDGSAVLLFQSDSKEIVEKCAANDPFVIHGVVNKWWVRGWRTVLGDAATEPLESKPVVKA